MNQKESYGDEAMHLSVAALAEDVHDTWRSILQPGLDTPFKPDIVPVQVDSETRHVDLANTEPQALPDQVKAVSERTSLFILRMLGGYVELRPKELDSMRLEKMAIMLFTMWDFIKQPRDLAYVDLENRMGLFPASGERVRLLDRRLVLAGVATTLDEARYPIWRQYDIAAVRAIPGLQYYGQKGRDMLEQVRGGQPVPLGSEVDNLAI